MEISVFDIIFIFSLNASLGDNRSATHYVRAKAKLLTIRTLHCKTYRLVHFREIIGFQCERHTKHIRAEFYILKQVVQCVEQGYSVRLF
jgi:hypothetical protein